MNRLPFTVAGGERAGIQRARMRALDLDRSIWGVRHPDPGDKSLETRCAMFALRMPGEALFSHATSALLFRAPLPFAIEGDSRLHIAVSAHARAPHATGILGHSLDLSPEDVVESNGLRHTSAARTWCDLAAHLSLLDLVAVGDYLIQWRLQFATQMELAACASRLAGRRGAKRMRESLPLLNDRSESRPESWLRVIIVRAGLPTPSINHAIVDAETGKGYRTDIAFSKHKVLLEYQGDYHRDQRQWRKDMTRRARLEANGWIVMEINADDVRKPVELAERIRTALRSRGWRG
ncbi:MAG: DUF559 domain-containing protein [Microbacteriaceae bacterium]|nr:DUF559 domain-containing protein [Microbacteriaceae bacterium]